MDEHKRQSLMLPSSSTWWDFPYPSQRMPVLAGNVVAASQPLAAQAGLFMLHKGGNAVDAALATAIALTVVEPTGNGLGSDAFAQVWDGGQVHGLNASGRAPRAWNLERFQSLRSMPNLGWDAVTVPGAVHGWFQLWNRFGKLDFDELFEPAVRYARDGFQVSPRIAGLWDHVASKYEGFSEFAGTFLPCGRAPRPGETFRNPAQAATLESLARTRGESMYRGELAEKIVAQSRAEGGVLSLEDLADHSSTWVEPLSQAYRGVDLQEIPPNGQGIAALMALGILGSFDLAEHPEDSTESLHLQIEAMKLAFAQVQAHVADPEFMDLSVEALLDRDRLKALAESISLDRALPPDRVIEHRGGTVYLSAADASGMMVSMIQSNYTDFGSGVVVKGTGISLQSRGQGFVLEPGHPNCVQGGKRPFHTIIPGFVTRNGAPVMSFGVMGGHMQPQGHVQVMVRMFDYGHNPQAACDAPRWCLTPDFDLALEPGFPAETVQGLKGLGHKVLLQEPRSLFGGAQLVSRLEHGYCAASEPRKDGQAVGF